MAEVAVRLDDVSAGTRSALFAVLLVAFGIKAAVFPLSSWLPDSYPTAPAPVTAVFAGLLTKVGVYAIIRAHTLLFPGAGLDRMLMVAAFLTMIVGILGAIAQSDIKRLLSFTLVSHIGYMVFGIALSSELGLSGAIYYVAHHILVQTTLFLVVGLIERQAGASTLQRLGGLAAASPLLAFVFVVPALNLGGIPPFSGFIGKVALLEAGAQNGSVLAWLLVGGSVRDQPADAVRDFPGLDDGVLARPRRRARGPSRGCGAVGPARRRRGHRIGRARRRRPHAGRHAGPDRGAHRGGADADRARRSDRLLRRSRGGRGARPRPLHLRGALGGEAMRHHLLRAWVLCWLMLVWVLLWGKVSAANIVGGLADRAVDHGAVAAARRCPSKAGCIRCPCCD